MAVFTRRPVAPTVKGGYTKFRPFVREDFSECCAYCLLHELMAGGERNFELDHFRPKSLPQFAALLTDFYHLYYCCHVCNHIKSNTWPPAEAEANGYGFVDLCRDVFSMHFAEEETGHWRPLTLAGEYTEDKLNLNSRHLLLVRKKLRNIAKSLGFEPINWDIPSKDQIARLMTPGGEES